MGMSWPAVAEADVQVPEDFSDWLIPIEASTEAESMVDHHVVFEELANRWHDETKFSSDTDFITSRDSYRQIIAMGQPAIPWILHDLATRGGDWFGALEAITGESPVPVDDVGFPRRMKGAWLAWGRARGISL